jgi:hypothetical protein
VTVAPQHRKASSADTVRRCTQNTLMFPRGSKTVAHAFDIDRQALPASSHRRSRGPVPIRVFCVHRLAASALKFLLCGAAGRCWRTHRQARVAANASAATPWHCACMAPRFGCGQRLRCVILRRKDYHSTPSRSPPPSWPAPDPAVADPPQFANDAIPVSNQCHDSQSGRSQSQPRGRRSPHHPDTLIGVIFDPSSPSPAINPRCPNGNA